MKLFKKNEKAVSPVLGVILMVAITVIIAAVVAAFIFGIGAPAKAPQASLAAKVSVANGVTIENQGGDAITLANTQVVYRADAASPATEESLGAITEGAVELGSATSLDPGETGGVTTAAGTVTLGNTAEVKIIDTPTGKLILDTKVPVTA